MEPQSIPASFDVHRVGVVDPRVQQPAPIWSSEVVFGGYQSRDVRFESRCWLLRAITH